MSDDTEDTGPPIICRRTEPVWEACTWSTEALIRLCDAVNHCGCPLPDTREKAVDFLSTHTGEPHMFDEEEFR